ncbi:MAG: type II toxin-antitoxin system RelE/ParE family toxin [Deltaproteobacteria bacterium]|nr:type II toxin-antitoxin system RelE/ParE family toxin [Deltaproteobacteria bacterium]
MKILWSPLALERIGEIADYLAQDNSAAAVKWVNTIFEKVARLKNLPFTGRVVPEINHDQIRELLYGNYRIIYQVEGKIISILTVRHGKQIMPTEEIAHEKDL